MVVSCAESACLTVQRHSIGDLAERRWDDEVSGQHNQLLVVELTRMLVVKILSVVTPSCCDRPTQMSCSSGLVIILMVWSPFSGTEISFATLRSKHQGSSPC